MTSHNPWIAPAAIALFGAFSAYGANVLFTAADAKGSAVDGIVAADLELRDRGHAVAITGLREVQPDSPDWRRSTVFILDDDDSGLEPGPARAVWPPPEQRWDAVTASLLNFVNERMRAGDRVAIVQTGFGGGVRDTLTGDREELRRRIGDIHIDPRILGDTRCFAAPCSQPVGYAFFSPQVRGLGLYRTLQWAIRGLAPAAGIKRIVLFSQCWGLLAPASGNAITDLALQSGVRVGVVDVEYLEPNGIRIGDGRIPGLDTVGTTRPPATPKQNGVGLEPTHHLGPVGDSKIPAGPASNLPRVTDHPQPISGRNIRNLAESTGGGYAPVSYDLSEVGSLDAFDPFGVGVVKPLHDLRYYYSYEVPLVQSKYPEYIRKGFTKVLDFPDSYYELEFSPASPGAEQNPIDLRPLRGGITLSFPHAYTGLATPVPAQQEWYLSLLDSPVSDAGIRADLTAFSTLSDPDGKRRFPVLRTAVAIDPRDLTPFTDADGARKLAADVEFVVFGSRVVQPTSVAYPTTPQDRVYDRKSAVCIAEAAALAGPDSRLVCGAEFQENRAGGYEIEAAIRDRNGSRLGAARAAAPAREMWPFQALFISTPVIGAVPESWFRRDQWGTPITAGPDNPVMRVFHAGDAVPFAFDLIGDNDPASRNFHMWMEVVPQDSQISVASAEMGPVPARASKKTDRTPIRGVLRMPKELHEGYYQIRFRVGDDKGAALEIGGIHIVAE